MLSMTNEPVRTKAAEITLIATPAITPARKDLVDHAVQNPAARKNRMAVYVVTTARVENVWGGTNQSSAVRVITARASRTPHHHTARHRNPAICRTYQESAHLGPRAGRTLSRYA